MATENKKALVYSILEFLKKSCDDGTIGQDDVEGIEGAVYSQWNNGPKEKTRHWTRCITVAMQCIGEAFSVDPSDPAQQEAYSTKPANLLNIFEIYLKTKAKSRGGAQVQLAWHMDQRLVSLTSTRML